MVFIIRLLFLTTSLTSAALFFFSIYAYFDGTVMEKQYKEIEKQIDKKELGFSERLIENKVTEYEMKKLSSRYNQDIYVYVSYVCYATNNRPGFDQKTILDVDSYNAECAKLGIPKESIRPEIESIYEEWAEYKEPLDKEIKKITSKVYSDENSPGKIDRNFLNSLSLYFAIGLGISIFFFLVLMLFTRNKQSKLIAKRRSRE